jgi:alanyl-tRNA synthetase
MSTERLYYRDSRLIEFTASVTGSSDGGCRVYLDRTAFYPESGGQPHDTGTVNGIHVVDIIDEDDGRIAHVLAAPLDCAAGSEVHGAVDWVRRFDHMQQHTGQHLLSAVLMELYGAQTVGFHLSAEYATIDLAVNGLDPAPIAAAESRANHIVFENRAVAVSFEDASAGPALRKPSARDGELRIITIDGFDRSACGGTHVSATGEIGPILVRKVERAHQSIRLSFSAVCAPFAAPGPISTP